MKFRTCVVSILSIFLIVVLAFGSYIQGGEGAEPPAPEWMQTYGGTSADVARSVIQTSDSGYLVAGDTMSLGAGDKDFWLIKVDSSGNHEWNKTYGGANADLPFSLVATSDGGYVLAGRTRSFGAGAADAWLVKTDASGNMEWNKTYGGPRVDVAHAVIQTSDGGYALAGYTESFGADGQDLWLVKTDNDGNLEWRRRFGGAGDEDSRGVIETSDGGYALAGFTTSFGAGGQDFWLIKVAGPPEYTFTIHSIPTGITFMVDSLSYSTSWTGTYEEGTSVSFEMPEIHTVGDAKYYWDQWSDGNTSRLRTVIMTTNITLTAYYTEPFYQLTVLSLPVTGIQFSINGVPKTTPYTEWLLEGSYTLIMPETHNGYIWSHWLEDGDTNRIRITTLPGTTYTAVYTTVPVGGSTISIESSYLLSWIASILLIISVVFASGTYFKQKKSEKE